MGGVIVILTRGMGERLTYGIPARYCMVLMERLGGLFFDGGCSRCLREIIIWSSHADLSGSGPHKLISLCQALIHQALSVGGIVTQHVKKQSLSC